MQHLGSPSSLQQTPVEHPPSRYSQLFLGIALLVESCVSLLKAAWTCPVNLTLPVLSSCLVLSRFVALEVWGFIVADLRSL